MSVTGEATSIALQAALRVRYRAERTARPYDALNWAREKATIVHPTRGRIPFIPRPFQERFLLDRAPRRLILKARQVGFSQVVGIEAVYKATFYEDRTILLVSRNQRLAAELLGYCYNAIAAIQGELPALVKNNTQELEFANGSRIISLPSNRSTGRGFAASDVYLDEYAYQAYATDVYRSVSPTVGNGGSLTVFSTPNGRDNHYFELWEGLEGGEWSRHNVPWRANPAYDDAWFTRERPNYTAQQWASEYDCDFVTSGLAVFRSEDITACGEGWLGLQPPVAGRVYLTFWDIGRRQDATVGHTLDITDPNDLQTVAWERELGLPYPVIQQRIEQRARAYGPYTFVESNGVGDPVIENLRVPVYPFVTTRKSKVDAITALALAHENHTFKHDIERLALECRLYQWRDENLIQDTVIAAAGAVYCATAPDNDQGIYIHDEPYAISPY